MKFNCYIIDDEPHAISTLENYISDSPNFNLAGSSLNPIIGLNEVNLISPHLLFLDIDMPQLNGIELSKLITTPTKIIFTTAYPNFAVEAFENEALDYLLKPIFFPRFIKCTNKLVQYFTIESNLNVVKKKSDFFYIKGDKQGSLLRIGFEEIVYVEADNNYVDIFTRQGKYVSYLTLKEVINFLPPEIFVKIHKSFVVNHKHIISIDGNQVYLSNKSKIQIGGHYRKLFFDFIEGDIIKTTR